MTRENTFPPNGDGADVQEGTCSGGEAAELVALLMRTDRAIVLTDRALRVSQPPMDGKIGVRWWVVAKGGDQMRMPVLVRWHRVKTGRWGTKPLTQIHRSRISPKGSTSAKLCANEMFELAKLAAGLIREYRDLRRALEYMLRELECMGARWVRVYEAEGLILHNYRLVLDKLEGERYAVDNAMRTMPDRYLPD